MLMECMLLLLTMRMKTTLLWPEILLASTLYIWAGDQMGHYGEYSSRFKKP